MTHELDRIDPTFVDDLRESRAAVNVAAAWLASKGYAVVVRPTFVRPDASVRSAYADNGDLEVLSRIEVKRLSIDFSSMADYPYPGVILCTCERWDNARPKPYAYVVLNREMTAAALVHGTSSPEWEKITTRNRGRVRYAYRCPVWLASFAAIPDACREGVA